MKRYSDIVRIGASERLSDGVVTEGERGLISDLPSTWRCEPSNADYPRQFACDVTEKCR
jgi:hypothetical protein